MNINLRCYFNALDSCIGYVIIDKWVEHSHTFLMTNPECITYGDYIFPIGYQPLGKDAQQLYLYAQYAPTY